MVSVVIAAHNEENVLGACLDALIAEAEAAGVDLEIIVSANGCTDATAEVAAARGAIVVDRVEPGKADALNAAESVATGFPRIYLDADIIVPPGGLTAVLERFDRSPAPLAVVPGRHVDTLGRPWPVRSYYAINERLPAFRDGLFGRGMITISKAGRGRFSVFPTLVADDLFLDAQFSAAEKVQVSDVEIVVEAPHTTRELIARLVRVRRGNSQMRAAADDGIVQADVRPSSRWSWLTDVVMASPRFVLAAVPYVLITLLAGVLARRRAGGNGAWGRADSTRTAAPSPAAER